MVVGGTVEHPTLGILDAGGQGVDLQGCGLYPESLAATFPVLAAFVTRASLTPYDVPARTGELKNLLVTQSPDGELMLRFVLRSQEPVARIRKHLPWLLDALPQLRVASVNLLPDHKAVLEGDREILLTATETLRMRVNGIDLHLRPQSFFQTNTRGRGRAVPARGVLGGGAGADERLGPVLRRRRVRPARGRARPGRGRHRDERRGDRERDPERRRPRPDRCAVRRRRRHAVRPRRDGAGPGDRQPAAAGHRGGAEPLAGGVRRAARRLLQLQRRLARPGPGGHAVAAAAARAGARHVPADDALRGAHAAASAPNPLGQASRRR